MHCLNEGNRWVLPHAMNLFSSMIHQDIHKTFVALWFNYWPDLTYGMRKIYPLIWNSFLTKEGFTDSCSTHFVNEGSHNTPIRVAYCQWRLTQHTPICSHRLIILSSHIEYNVTSRIKFWHNTMLRTIAMIKFSYWVPTQSHDNIIAACSMLNQDTSIQYTTSI